jgi:hypothetical protein
MSTTKNLGLTKIETSDYISPDPINDAIDAIDMLGKVYITAIGESNGWYYIKLSNNFVVCSAIITGTTTESTSLNAKKTYPVTFSSAPRTVAGGGVSGVITSGVQHVGRGTTQADVYISNPDAKSGKEWWASIIAFGKVSG